MALRSHMTNGLASEPQSPTSPILNFLMDSSLFDTEDIRSLDFSPIFIPTLVHETWDGGESKMHRPMDVA